MNDDWSIEDQRIDRERQERKIRYRDQGVTIIRNGKEILLVPKHWRADWEMPPMNDNELDVLNRIQNVEEIYVKGFPIGKKEKPWCYE
jgi:hypothetical protein